MKKGIITFLLLSLSILSCNKNVTSPNDINQADRDFIFHGSFANAGELGISALADTVSTDSTIMDFAGYMVTQHTSIEQIFSSLADNFSYYTADSLNAENLALQQQLLTLSGREFDSVYIHSRVKNHTDMIAIFTDEKNNGLSPHLKTFADSVLPVLQMHLSMADSLAQKYK